MDGNRTLETYLALGYWHATHGGVDPAPACRRDIPATDIHTKAQELSLVKDRDHVSRVRLAFIQRVLALPIAAPSAT